MNLKSCTNIVWRKHAPTCANLAGLIWDKHDDAPM